MYKHKPYHHHVRLSSLYLVDNFAAFLADTNFFATVEESPGHARRLAAGRTHEHRLGGVERRLEFNDPTPRIFLRRAHVLRHHIDIFDDDRFLGGIPAQDLALFPSVLAGDHIDAVTLPQTHFRHHQAPYTTSGARETIRM